MYHIKNIFGQQTDIDLSHIDPKDHTGQILFKQINQKFDLYTPDYRLTNQNNSIINSETIVTPGNYFLVIGKRQMVYTLPGDATILFANSLEDLQPNNHDYDDDDDNEDYRGRVVEEITIHRWGDHPYNHLCIADHVTDKITILAKDTPNLTKCRSLSRCFSGQLQIIGDLSQWDTSNVTDMSHMFVRNTFFNGDISNFNTSKVTDMNNMFAFNTAFNQSLSNFDTSKVTDMSWMFRGNTAFNQPLSNFDTSNVINMTFMFAQNTAFNQTLSNFNTSNVKDMIFMFGNNNTFNHSRSNFNTSNVTV